MIKHVNGWELSKKLEECNVYVKHFSKAQVCCVKDYLNSSLSKNLGHSILHVGTNSLDIHKGLKLKAKSIVDVACSLKNESHDV